MDNEKPENKKIEWNRELTKKLIQLYEDNPCLYDTKHTFYSNKHARQDAHFKICGELKQINPAITTEDVKKKLINLRSQFTHEHGKLKKKPGKTGDSADEIDEEYETTAWWYEPLSFLTTHIKGRKGRSTLDREHTNKDETENDTTIVRDSNDSEVDNENITLTNTNTRPKKIKQNNGSSSTAIECAIEKTLSALQHGFENPLQEDASGNFARYIENELRVIDDEEILTDLKFEISSIIYSAKKKWIAKRKAGIVILENSE